MTRWLYGTVLMIYLAGTLGFGLAGQISGSEPDIAGAMSYGAAWPWIVLRMLEIV